MYRSTARSGERGSVLIISLLILVVMTLISVTAMRTTIVEEKMAGNTRDINIAHQAAEAALREAEIYLENITSVAAFNGDVPGLYPIDSDVDPFDDDIWDGTNNRTYSGALSDVASDPKYIIELVSIGESDPLNIGNYGESSGAEAINSFRIIVRANGITENSFIYLREYYGRAM